jgi:hypothetical protein
MSSQQLNGLALLLVGVATLILSAGIAWALARRSRTQRVESSWLITLLSFGLLLAGAALCYIGVSKVVDGGA